MENKTPTPSTSTQDMASVGTGIGQGNINGARAGQKSGLISEESSTNQRRASSALADEAGADVGTSAIHAQDFGSDDFNEDETNSKDFIPSKLDRELEEGSADQSGIKSGVKH